VPDFKAIIANVLAVDPKTLTPETKLNAFDRWNSLAHIEIIVAIEEEFQIQLNQDEIVEMTSIAAIAEVLARHTAS